MSLKMTLAKGGFSRFPAEVLLIISQGKRDDRLSALVDATETAGDRN
jgi:hypothetical protein